MKKLLLITLIALLGFAGYSQKYMITADINYYGEQIDSVVYYVDQVSRNWTDTGYVEYTLRGGMYFKTTDNPRVTSFTIKKVTSTIFPNSGQFHTFVGQQIMAKHEEIDINDIELVE